MPQVIVDAVKQVDTPSLTYRIDLLVCTEWSIPHIMFYLGCVH
jgi:hypothetical protein